MVSYTHCAYGDCMDLTPHRVEFYNSVDWLLEAGNFCLVHAKTRADEIYAWRVHLTRSEPESQTAEEYALEVTKYVQGLNT